MKTKNLSIKELALLIGVHPDTVRRAARSGLIPFTKHGRAYQFDWEKVRRAMRERANHRLYRRKGQASARPPADGGGVRSVMPPDGNTGAWLTP